MATHFSIFAWRIPMDRGAWQATVHGVAKGWTLLSTEPAKGFGSPLSWPTVLTVSPALINFVVFSFYLTSGNSFPTLTQTMTVTERVSNMDTCNKSKTFLNTRYNRCCCQFTPISFSRSVERPPNFFECWLQSAYPPPRNCCCPVRIVML